MTTTQGKPVVPLRCTTGFNSPREGYRQCRRKATDITYSDGRPVCSQHYSSGLLYKGSDFQKNMALKRGEE